MSPCILNNVIKISARYREFYIGEKQTSIHIQVLKLQSLGKYIIFQQKSKLVSFHFISHSELYCGKNM